MVSTPEVCTNNSPIKLKPYVSTKNPSAIKSLHQFSETSDVKHKTSVCGLGADKENCKSIKIGSFCDQTLQSALVVQK